MTSGTVDLLNDIETSGFHPRIVWQTVTDALAGEEVESHVLQVETTFDQDRVHQHLTVLVLTPTRLILVHVDDSEEGALALYETVPLRRVGTVAVTRGVADPAGANPRTIEMGLAIEWGAVRRIELEPTVCPDPACEAEHGLNGQLMPDDVALRVSAQVEGNGALDRLEAFARDLSRALVQVQS